MRRSWVWGLGMSLLLGLGIAAVSARADDEDDDDIKAATKPGPKKYGSRGLFEGLFDLGSKPAEKKPSAKADKLPKPTVTVEKSEKDAPGSGGRSAHEMARVERAREQAAWVRRQAVCDRLKAIADQGNDEELYKLVEGLEQRAWAVYRQRTAHLSATGSAAESDEQVLDRHLGGGPAAQTSKSAADLKNQNGRVGLEGKP